MIRNITVLVIALAFAWPSTWATVFYPVPLDKQLQESDGLLQATYVGLNYKRIGDKNEIYTEAIFRVTKMVGLPKEEVIYKDSFKILYPGGVWEGKVSFTYGSPQFRQDEEYILLVKKGRFGYELSNLSMGKYDLVKDNGVLHVVSSVYPYHPRLGRMKYSALENFVHERWGQNLGPMQNDYNQSVTENDSTIANRSSNNPKREMASTKTSGPIPEDNSQKYWPYFLFVILGVLSFFKLRGRQL
ncbi:MAG: hypothetical protein WCG27_02620 [Pseudomonadota bacterium]